MFPTELAILMAIVIAKNSDNGLDTRSTDVPGAYIDRLYSSLVIRGYIKRNGSEKYLLTEKGREVFFEFLRENGTRLGDATRTLQRLGIETSQRIHELEKQAVMV